MEKKLTKNLHILGDPLIDNWILFEDNFKLYGGAANVWENSKQLLSATGIEVESYFMDPFEHENLVPHKKYLIEESELGKEITDYNDESYPLKVSNKIFNNKIFNSLNKTNYLGLIVSDYNKGFVDYVIKNYKNEFPHYDFIILDSRYGNTDLLFLKQHSDILIKRTTVGTDKETNSLLIDFEIKTNAVNPVEIYYKQNGTVKKTVQNNPKSNILMAESTCGAGDMFTSSLGCWLMNKDIDFFDYNYDQEKNEEILNHIKEGSEFAFETCQESVHESIATCKTKRKI